MEKNFKVIGLLGKKRSGKNTIGDYLVSNKNYVEYSFANPLKFAVMSIFGFTHSQMWGSELERESIDPRWNVSPRKMLQIVGTELFQYDIHKYMKEDEFTIGRSIWVHRFKLWYQEEISKNPNLKVVITDIRFKHELDVLKELNGVSLRIIRPSILNIDTHTSEQEIDTLQYDYTIINDGEINDLYLKIEEIIK